MLIDRPEITESSFIINAVVQSGSSNPTQPSIGELFFRTDLGKLQVYGGSSWVTAGSEELATHVVDFDAHLTPAQNSLLDGLSPTLTSQQLNFVEGATSSIQDQINSVVSNTTSHINNGTLHLTSAQSSFLSGLNLPTLTSAEVNRLVGVTSPIQEQFSDINTSRIHRSGTIAMTGNLQLGANRIVQLAAPIDDTDAANKLYVDNSILSAMSSLSAGSGIQISGSTISVSAGNGLTFSGNNLTLRVSSDFSIASTQLQLSSISAAPAGTYGSSNTVPVITTDGKGRITGITTSSISTDYQPLSSNLTNLSTLSTDGYVVRDSSGQFVTSATAGGIQEVNGLPNPFGYTGAKIVFNTLDGKLYSYVGGQWELTVPPTTEVTNGTITVDSFASGIRPVEIVSSLPTTGNVVGRLVYLTTDGKLYFFNGTEWVSSVDVSDLTGQLTDEQIADINAAKITGQILSQQIADASITLAKFATGIRPIEVVDILPTTGNFQGRTVFLTTDSKIYRFNGTQFVSTIPAVDILGQLTDQQIAELNAAKIIGQLVASQIADASLTTAKFASSIKPIEIVSTLPLPPHVEGRIVFLTTDDKLYRNTGSGWVATVAAVDVAGQLSDSQLSAISAAKITGQVVASQIADAAVTTAKFASGIRPVEVVSVLPTTGNFEGRIAYLTTDNKLYRHDGTDWISTVPSADITGQLTSSQIADLAASKITGQVVASQIADAAVTTAKFASGIRPVEVVSTLPTTGNFQGRIAFLTADGKLYRHDGTNWISTVSSSDITGQLSDAQIAALSAAKITGQVVASQISDAAITTAKFASGIRPVEVVSTLPTAGNFEGRIAYLTTDNKMYRHDGTNWISAVSSSDITGQLSDAQIAAVDASKITGQVVASQIADAAITTAKFAAGIEPIEVVSTLPATGNFQGRTAFLTTDNKIYRHNGTGWISTVASTDLTGQLSDSQIAAVAASKLTGQITSTQISDNAVTTAKIAAGSITTASLAADAVTADKIAANAVTASEIAAGSITTAKLAAGAVTANELAANSVIAGKVAAGAISATEISSGAITTAKLAAGAVTANEIASNAITAAKIDAGAITTAKLAAGAVTANELAANSVIAGKVAAGAISATEIAAGAVTTAKLAAGAVTANEIASNAITAGKIEAGAITTAKLAAGAVTANELAANSVIAGKVAAGAISATEIAAGAVTTAKLAAGAVTANELAANSVTAGKILAGEITGDKIAANAITTAKLAAGAVTANELAANSVIAGKVAAGAISATEIAAGAITASKLFITDTSMVVPDADLADNNSWSGASVWETPPSTTWRGSRTAQLNAAAGTYATLTSLVFPVEAGHEYHYSWQGQVLAGSGIVAAQLVLSASASMTTPAWAVIGSTSSTSLSEQVGIVTIPAGYRYARFQFYKNNDSTTSVRVGGPILRRATSGELIVDGAITAAKIQAATITSAQIAADTITAANIAANAITASEISAGAITTAKLAAGAVTANELAANSVVAGKVAAGAISATEIASGAITTAKLAAGAVTANELAANSVTAGKILAGEITGDKIAANTITASNIAAETITAAQIAANSITSSELAANSVIAGKVAAGAISADQIAAGAITSEKMLISNFSNLIENPSFESGQVGWTNASRITADAVNAQTGTNVYVYTSPSSTATVAAESNIVRINAGESYRLSGWAKSSAGASGTFMLNIRFYDSTDTAITPLSLLTWTAPTTSYTQQTEVFTAPANATYFRVALRTAGTGTFYWDNISCTRAADGSLIVDGSISALKILAGAITTEKLAAGAVTADTIAANAITTPKINAGAITAAQIAAGAVTASALAANSITAGTIAAGAVSASNIAANSITGDRIAAGAISTTELAAGAVTAAKISVTSLSAVAANLGTVTAGTLRIQNGSTVPAVSGTTMTGAGALINSTGTFAFGNSTTNISFNGTQMTLNGNIVATENVNLNAITETVGATYTGNSAAGAGGQMSFAIASSGGKILILAGGTILDNTTAVTLQLRRHVGAGISASPTTLFTITATSGAVTFPPYFDQPAAGTYTYEIYKTAGPGMGPRTIVLTEFKR